MEEELYWLGFSAFPGIGSIKFQKLLKSFGNAKSAWNCSKNDLGDVIGLTLLAKFDSFRTRFSIKFYAQEIKKRKISFLTLQNPDYPRLLLQIKTPRLFFMLRER